MDADMTCERVVKWFVSRCDITCGCRLYHRSIVLSIDLWVFWILLVVPVLSNCCEPVAMPTRSMCKVALYSHPPFV